MQLTPEAWIWLAASIVAAVIVDVVVTRLLLEVFRPASAYVFGVGRGGKVAAVCGWIAFIVAFWYPQFIGGEQPDWLKLVALGIIIGLLVLSFITHPKRSRSAGDA
jgi:hypothetical protein